MSTWQELAKQLAFGQKIKVVCCGTSASAYVSNSPKGISHYCFRSGCDQQHWEPHKRLSAADYLRYKQNDVALKATKAPVVVPISEAPREARLWLLLAGISPEVATEQFKIGWHDKTQRVILPLLPKGNRPDLFLGRAVMQGQQPKYLISNEGNPRQYYGFHTDWSCVVVVEDILSCIKLHLAGYSSMAMLGTNVPLPVSNLAAKYEHVISWFDNDAAGSKARKKLQSSVGLVGVPVSHVITDKDPKYYSTTDMHEHIRSTYD